ncbi:MAG: transcriptional regulator [Anaerolineaceae bacterium]|nr:transcriptional regulator [Anaerolineaceae bacterium]
MAEDLHSLVEIDRLVHEPARLVILTILNAVEKADFLYLLRETGLTRGNLSSHLSKLEEAGYLQIEKTYKGKVPQTLVSITEQGRDAFITYRQKLNDLVQRINKD